MRNRVKSLKNNSFTYYEDTGFKRKTIQYSLFEVVTEYFTSAFGKDAEYSVQVIVLNAEYSVQITENLGDLNSVYLMLDPFGKWKRS